MKIIVPMAGFGDRFIKRGYSDPKPLIEINGKKIIEYIIEMFSKNDEYVFICNEVHLKETNMEKILKEILPDCTIVSIPQHKQGPVHTVKYSYDFINDDEEIIVSYCDNPLVWDRHNFLNFLNEKGLDGCILTHTGFHPHTLSSTKMAFIKENDGIVTEIKEKESYTNTPQNEHASTGVYYFKTGKILKKYFDELVKNNINYNGEFYVTLVYNLLIRDGLKVGYYDTPFVTVFGTPEEVQNFESWSTILGESQIKNEEDLINCYRYWKKYFKKINEINIT
jgi:NDP-sugar pyrophosphorylase family protein